MTQYIYVIVFRGLGEEQSILLAFWSAVQAQDWLKKMNYRNSEIGSYDIEQVELEAA